MRILKESNFLLWKFYLILHRVLLAFCTSRNKQTCKVDAEICSQTVVPGRIVEPSHGPGAMLCKSTLRQLQPLCVQHHLQAQELHSPYSVVRIWSLACPKKYIQTCRYPENVLLVSSTDWQNGSGWTGCPSSPGAYPCLKQDQVPASARQPAPVLWVHIFFLLLPYHRKHLCCP